MPARHYPRMDDLCDRIQEAVDRIRHTATPANPHAEFSIDELRRIDPGLGGRRQIIDALEQIPGIERTTLGPEPMWRFKVI